MLYQPGAKSDRKKIWLQPTTFFPITYPHTQVPSQVCGQLLGKLWQTFRCRTNVINLFCYERCSQTFFLFFPFFTADNYFKLGTTDIFRIFDLILLAPSVTSAVPISFISFAKLATLRSIDNLPLGSSHYQH